MLTVSYLKCPRFHSPEIFPTKISQPADINREFTHTKHTINLGYFNVLIAELGRAKGPPSGAPYSYGKGKETNEYELIF